MALLFIMISHCFKVRVSNQLAFRVRRAVTWLRKQPTFRNASSGFPAKWRLRNEHSAEMPYWWRVTIQIWVVLLIASERAPMSSYGTRLIRTPHYYGQFVLSPPPRGGVLPYISHRGMFHPKGYGFCADLVWKRVETQPILVWNRYGFQGNYGSVRKYLSFQFQMNKKKEKSVNSKWILRNLSCCRSNLSNDDIIS